MNARDVLLAAGAFGDVLDDLDVALDDLVDPADLATIAHRLDGLNTALALVRDKAKRLCHERMGGRWLEVDGVGRVERTTDYRRRFTQEAIGDALTRVVGVALDAGEIGHPHDVLAVVRECASFSALKGKRGKPGEPASGIVRFGLDLDDWSTKDPRPTVRFHGVAVVAK